MEKGFADYYTANKKNYTFKVKIAKCELTKEDNSNIDCCFEKYKVVSKGSVKKTPLQENPLDFPNIKNTEVHIFEVTVEYPITSEVLRREISEATGVNSNAIAVYNKNDPREEYTKEMIERRSKEFKDSYVPKLGTVPEFKEEQDLHGEKFVNGFLKDLENERKNRKVTVVTNDLIPDQKTDTVGVSGPEKGKINTTSVFNKTGHIDPRKL